MMIRGYIECSVGVGVGVGVFYRGVAKTQRLRRELLAKTCQAVKKFGGQVLTCIDDRPVNKNAIQRIERIDRLSANFVAVNAIPCAYIEHA